MATKTNGRVPAVSFGKLKTGMDMPNLLDVQVRAFQTLLQTDAAEAEREDVGLERVFNEVFPITDVNDKFSLEYVNYSLGEPKYSVEECIERDMTYAAPLKATLRLVVWEDVEDAERRPKDIIEKEVYLGDLPLLTELGTFIINGSERVIVSQLHRSPGVVFEETIHPNGSKLFSARIIPFRGSWVEFTVDIHDVIFVHIDKKKKFPATALLRAFGYSSDEDVLRLFYTTKDLELSGELDAKGGGRRDVLGLPARRRCCRSRDAVRSLPRLPTRSRRICSTGLRRANIEISEGLLERPAPAASAKARCSRTRCARIRRRARKRRSRPIYSLLRPGEPPNIETAELALTACSSARSATTWAAWAATRSTSAWAPTCRSARRMLTQEDFIAIIRYLIELNEGRGFVDDIDHLGNRRVR